MNCALALHLLRKDMRWRRVELVTLWVLLAAYAGMPLVPEQLFDSDSGKQWWLLTQYFLVTCTVGLLILLQLDFVQGDHPNLSEGFLKTRPMDGKQFLAAKLLGWFTVAAMPALLAVQLNLALCRLDLRFADHLRVGLRNLLMLLGICGVVSVFGTLLLSRRRAALFVSLLVVSILLLMQPGSQMLWENLSESGLTFWVMEESRMLAAWSLALSLGFVLTACILARIRGTSVLILLGMGVLLCVLVRWFWPINLVWRDDHLVAHDSARLDQLKKLTTVKAGGDLWLGDQARGVPSRTTALRIDGESGLEFPEVSAYDVAISMPDGRQYQRSMRPVGLKKLDYAFNPIPQAQTRLDLEGIYPPIKEALGPEAMVKALGPPPERATELREHFSITRPGLKDHSRELGFENLEPVGANLWTHAGGKVTLDWTRVTVQGELPLNVGAHYAHDGHRLEVREVRIVDEHLHLRLSLRRSRSLLHRERAFDSNDRMVLWVANPVRGDLVIPQPLKSGWHPYSLIRDVETEDVEVQCFVLDGGSYSNMAHMDAQWMQQARLYILARQGIGQTEQSFNGDFVTHILQWDYQGR